MLGELHMQVAAEIGGGPWVSSCMLNLSAKIRSLREPEVVVLAMGRGESHEIRPRCLLPLIWEAFGSQSIVAGEE